MRNLFCSALALALCCGVVVAEEKKKEEAKKAEAKAAKPKNTSVSGAFKKFDAASGTLTLVVKAKKGETADKEVKLADTSKVVVFEGETKKEGKEGLGTVKEGTPVQVGIDPSGKVLGVRIGTPPPKKKK